MLVFKIILFVNILHCKEIALLWYENIQDLQMNVTTNINIISVSILL